MENHLKKERKIILFLISFFIGISFLLYYSYRYIEKTIVESEKEKLILTATNSSRAVSDFFLGQANDLDLFFEQQYETKEALEHDLQEYSFISSYPYMHLEIMDESTLQVLFSEQIIPSKTGYFAMNKTQEHQFDLLITKPIMLQDKKVILVEWIDLNQVYELFLSGLQYGKYGYSTLKDEDGIIVMHGVPSQIGLDSLNDRKEKYHELDDTGINQLLEGQLSGNAGCNTVVSYWWGKEDLGLVRKLIAYAPLYLNDQLFVLNVIASFDGVTAPVRTMFFVFVTIVLLIILFLTFGITLLLKSKKDYQNLQLQTSYENEIKMNNFKMMQQQEQAMKSEKLNTLGLLSSSISHEIRNLITPILVYCDLLEPVMKTEEDHISLNEIHTLAARCNELTSQLTQYSRSENDKLSMEVIDLNEVVASACQMIRGIMPSRIKFELDLLNEPFTIFANRSAIYQILLNCATNSIDAMEKEGIFCVSLKKENESIFLVIKDNGHGMSEEVQKKAFEPFFTTKAPGKGTGLGFSVIKRMVTLMQGSMVLHSVENQGTTLTFQFHATPPVFI